MKNTDTVIISEKEAVNINLHLNEYDKGVMSDFQKDFLSEELAGMPPLEDGQVSINGVYTFDMGDKIEVSVYLRNGLANQINFHKVPLVIINQKGEVLAKQIMDMHDFGILPPFSARPYKVYFDKINVFVDTIPMDDWKIQFEKSISAIKTVKVELDEMPKDMDRDLKNSFIKFLNKLPLIRSGDVNIEVFKTLRCMDNSISVVFLILNGYDKIVKLERLPILIVDEQGEVVAKGIFDIENINVNPHKAKIYDFTITEEYIVNKDYDISNCKVYFKA
ncbi:SLAP domain-containing protein [Clostridium tagluense]|uniref:SLAP domain-containing protein n=1 Tax=Clostridium tagluense TaxID=360422 RepID=UPI001C0DC168|nr:SLAP domain-containing protein [Clostridium tagluense]MBU3130328.1 SLAP domain-containing protein [Clostridium tagluense]MCB2313896.1 SLAP domain-containing protein [Clostridium tagluense]MCB2318735.1 SLAP domain-containing protein [Clostridium tagluense]MCB2323468.1 SLAP domain-containing protein [Clostridium tagluense]MCB2328457.1 SLAP domain-containing protein [Clostridium tagluense]